MKLGLAACVLTCFAVVVTACSDEGGPFSSSPSSSSSSSSSSSGGSGSKPNICRKNVTTGTCECSAGSLSVDSEWTEVPNCDSAPSGALICATYADATSVSNCLVRVPHCAEINRDSASCECGFSSELAQSPISTCSDTICCQFDDVCQCTSSADSSFTSSQFDGSCQGGYKTGTKVASCTAAKVKQGCEGGTKEVTSCAGLKWASPESAGGGGSSSGSSGECTGCHANSDCGSCEYCELSTCSCRSKSVCR